MVNYLFPNEIDAMLKLETEVEVEGSPLWTKDVRDKFERSMAAQDSNRYAMIRTSKHNIVLNALDAFVYLFQISIELDGCQTMV
jgi:hypothetical protein